MHRTWRIVIAVIVFTGSIALFGWTEYRLGIFRWWHAFVLLGALLLGVFVRAVPLINKVVNRVDDLIGFETESPGSSANIRREYFMALVPMYFIVSAYLMQSALRIDKVDTWSMILSISVLLFALYLVIASFIRALPPAWARNTFKLASTGAVLGSLVFFIDLIKATHDLANLGASVWYINIFVIAGSLGALGITAFYIMGITKKE